MEEEKLNESEKKEEKKKEKKVDELALAKADAEHWKNEYYKAFADMQNLRKSIEKDHREALKYRAEGFVDEIINVLNNFQAVLGNEVTSPELKNYLIGFQYIYKNLVTVLENEGVKEFAPQVGDTFDESFMQALETEESDDEPNKVIKVMTHGYKLHDHLVRPALVKVTVKRVAETQTKDENDSVKA